MQAVDPTVHRQFLAAFPGVERDGGLADVRDLLDDVQLAEPVCRLSPRRRHDGLMLLPHVLDVAQPVVTQAEPIAPERREHAAATVMPADDDVAHFQEIDCELHDGQTVQIRVDDEVGDVAVHEKFSGQQIDDFVCRDAAVGAADPEILRRLLAGKFEKEIRLLPPNPF